MKNKKRNVYIMLTAVLFLLTAFVVADRMSFKKLGPTHANDSGVINIEEFSIKINGKEPVDGDEVRDGDEVSIGFKWSIDNTNLTTSNFSVDMSEYLHKLTLSNSELSDLLDDGGENIGQFKIEDNVMHIFLGEKYVTSTSERHGGASIEGVVDTQLDSSDNGKKVPIGIAEQVYELIYISGEVPDAKPGSAWIDKTQRGLQRENGRLFQTYVISFGANWEGTGIKGLRLTDTPGNGLNNPSSIKVEQDSAGVLQSEYADFAALNQALASLVLTPGQSVRLVYTMDVDEKDVMKETPAKDYTNTVKLIYDGGTDDTKNQEKEDTEHLYFRKPAITKAAIDNRIAKDGTVTWEITVYLYDVYTQGTTLKDYTDSIKDIPLEGIADMGEKTIPASAFTMKHPGIYSYTYTTKVSDDYLNSAAARNIRNRAEVTVGGQTYSGEAGVSKPAKDWIKKENVGYDSAERQISWKVTLDPIPANLTSFTVYDSTTDWHMQGGSHTLVGDISVKCGNGESVKVVENGQFVPNNAGVSAYNVYNDGKLYFEDAFMAGMAGSSMEIYYTSKINDADINGKVYLNRAHVAYQENGIYGNQSAQAEWKRDNAVSKTGKVVEGENSIQYTVKVDLDSVGELTASENAELLLEDTLPSGMELVPSSVEAKMMKYYSIYWSAEWMECPVSTTPVVEKGIVRFPVKITQEMLDKIRALKSSEPAVVPYIYITYTAKMDDEAVVRFTEEGSRKQFTNTVVGSYKGEPIGDYTVVNELDPKKAVIKEYEYNVDTAPYIYYKITINPDGLNFSDDDWLEAVDQLGGALLYDLDSISVEEITDGGKKKQEAGKDYTYTYDFRENSITFRLKDETPLILTYRVRVNLYLDANDSENNGEMTPENSYNIFSLSGYNSDKTSDRTSFNQLAITPRVWAQSTSGRLTLYKYSSDEESVKPLSGAEFALRYAYFDQESGQMAISQILPPNDNAIKVDENGQYTIRNLLFDQYYAIYETKAPDGYEMNTDVSYFVIKGSSNRILPEGVREFNNGSWLYIENKKESEPKGKLRITKELIGLEDDKKAMKSLRFTVTSDTTTEEYPLEKFTYDPEEKNYVLELTEPVGKYTVTESVSSIDGYIINTLTHTVNGGNPNASNTGTVTVEKNESVEIGFKDEYMKNNKGGKLLITKTIEGEVTKEELNGALQFTVKNGYNQHSDTYYLRDFTYNDETKRYELELEREAEKYTVTETVYDVKGYKTEEVTYQIDNDVPVEGTGTEITVETGKTKTVSFKDKYTKDSNAGSLKITKSIRGDVPKEAAKNSLQFTVVWKNGENVSSTNYSLKDFTYDPQSQEYSLEFAAAAGSYTITESVTEISGYTLQQTSYAINDGLASNGRRAEVEVAENSENKVAFMDVYEAEEGELVLTKKVDGAKREDAENALRFTVVSDKSTEQYTLKNFTYDEASGLYRLKLTKRTGTYKITETASSIDGYILQSRTYRVDASSPENGNSVNAAVKKGGSTTVAFEDKYEESAKNGKLKITKTILGPVTPEEAKGALQFQVSDSGTKQTDTYSLRDFTYNEGSGQYELELTKAVGVYTVKESVYDIEGYVIKEAAYQIDGDGAVVGTQADDISIQEGATKTIAFKDEYEKNADAKELVITKVIEGEVSKELAENSLQFTVTNHKTGVFTKYSLGDFTFDQSTQRYTLKLSAMAGDYTVTESVSDIQGFVTRKVSYVVNAGTTVTGKQAEVTVGESEAATVDFKDTYSSEKGVLMITKTLEGDVTREEAEGALRFTVASDKSIANYTLKDDFIWNEKTKQYTLRLRLPATDYVVTESICDIDGYVTKKVSYVLNGDKNNSTTGDHVKVSVSQNHDTTVDFTDEYVKSDSEGNLKITKTIEGPVTKEELEGALAFTVTNNSNQISSTYTLRDFKYQANTGKYVLELNKAPGSYTITETETDINGYVTREVSYSVHRLQGGELIDQTENGGMQPGKKAVVNLGKDESVQVDFKDAYDPDVNAGKLRISKTIEGDVTKEEAEGALQFTVTDNSTGKSVNYLFKSFTYDPEQDEYYLELAENEGGYTVTESVSDIAGYVKQKVLYKIDDGSEVNGTQAEVTVSKELVTHVAFKDVYTTENEKGTLVLTKTLKGAVTGKQAEGVLKFTVTNIGNNESITYGLNEFEYEKADGRYVLVLDVAAGNYLVTESVSDIKGFKTASITYTVNAEKAKEGREAQIDIDESATVTVDFVDEYLKEEGRSSGNTPAPTPTKEPEKTAGTSYGETGGNSEENSTNSQQTGQEDGESQVVKGAETGDQNEIALLIGVMVLMIVAIEFAYRYRRIKD